MPTIVSPHYGSVHLPKSVMNLRAFRNWIHSAGLPEKLPIHFLRGEIWADFSRGDPLANVLLRGKLISALCGLVEEADLGLYFTSGMLWSNDDAGFATEPDGGFISAESIRKGRVWFSNGGNTSADATEIIGSPDMITEIISDKSEEKDTGWLMEAYFRAGVQEYWLFDVRDERTRFDIYIRDSVAFKTTRKRAGWMRSAVFGRKFHLSRSIDQHGLPLFKIEVR